MMLLGYKTLQYILFEKSVDLNTGKCLIPVSFKEHTGTGTKKVFQKIYPPN
jgi:hypothetical protein